MSERSRTRCRGARLGVQGDGKPLSSIQSLITIPHSQLRGVSIPKILIDLSGSELAGFDFRGIIKVPIADMVKQVPEREKHRMPSKLQNVRQFVKHESDCQSVRRLYRTVFPS
jgi:hypothetical protein